MGSVLRWRKSRRSSPNGENCVELARDLTGEIAVRDSKAPEAAAYHRFSVPSFATFLAAVKRGEFDL